MKTAVHETTMPHPIPILFTPSRFLLRPTAPLRKAEVWTTGFFLILLAIFIWREHFIFSGISLGMWIVCLLVLPPVRNRGFRLTWENRMQDTWVRLILVDQQHLRIIKTNSAALLFPRQMHAFAVLMFQERGQDRFCLEVSYACHTPRYFFLGKEKDPAEMLLNSLGLPSFESRFPVQNAQKNWEAIPTRLNDVLSKKRGILRGFFRTQNPYKKSGRAASKEEMKALFTHPFQAADNALFSCLLQWKEMSVTTVVIVRFFDIFVSVGMFVLFLQNVFPSLYAVTFSGYPWTLFLLLGSCAIFWSDFWVLTAKYRCFFRVTEKGLEMTTGYGSPFLRDCAAMVLLWGRLGLLLAMAVATIFSKIQMLGVDLSAVDVYPQNLVVMAVAWPVFWRGLWVWAMGRGSFFRVAKKNPNGPVWWYAMSVFFDYGKVCVQKKPVGKLPTSRHHVQLVVMDTETGATVNAVRFDRNFGQNAEKDLDELLHILVETADRVLQEKKCAAAQIPFSSKTSREETP